MGIHDGDSPELRSWLAGIGTKGYATSGNPGLPPLPSGSMVHDGMNGFGAGDAAGVRWLTSLQPGADFDYEAAAGDTWRNAPTAACLRVIKTNFPQPQLQVVSKAASAEQEEAIFDHPLVSLIENPNPGYDSFAFEAALALSAIIDGNAYAIKVRSAAGIPVEMWWTPPWMMEPAWDPSGKEFISLYKYYVNGRTYIVDPKDVLHWRWGGLDPRNPRKGLSDFKAAAARLVCGLNEVDTFTAAVLRNSGIPSVVISPSGGNGVPGGVDQARRMKNTWKEQFTGEGRGEPYVSTLPVTVTPIGWSPEQLALDRIPARMEDLICALTGVNPMVAGLTSGAQHKTYNNMAEARRGYYEDTQIPMQASLAECFTRSLLGDPGMGDPRRQRVRYSYHGIPCLREAQGEIWDRAGKAYKEYGGIRRSEYRNAIGLPADKSDEIFYAQAQPAQPAPPAAAGNPGFPGGHQEPDGDEDSEGTETGEKMGAAVIVLHPGGQGDARDPFFLASPSEKTRVPSPGPARLKDPTPMDYRKAGRYTGR